MSDIAGVVVMVETRIFLTFCSKYFLRNIFLPFPYDSNDRLFGGKI